MARKIRPMDDYGQSEEVTPPPARSADGKTPAGGSMKAIPPPGDIPMGYPMPAQPPSPPTKFPQIAGVLLIITALILAANAYSLLMIDTEDYVEEVSRSFQLYSNSDGTVTLTGAVTDVDGEPIEGLVIFVVPPDDLDAGHDLNATTDKNGTYEIEDVPVGKQLIIVSGDNYTTIEHKIFLEADLGGSGDDPEVSFVLEEGTGTKRTGNFEGELYDIIDAYLTICSTLLIIAIVMVLIGAVFTFLRKRYYVAIIGCIFGIIFGLGLVIGTILAIIAVYLIVKSKAVFEKKDIS